MSVSVFVSTALGRGLAETSLHYRLTLCTFGDLVKATSSLNTHLCQSRNYMGLGQLRAATERCWLP